MFHLTKNEFVAYGKCWYEDEFGNKAIMIRNEQGFKGKLRFVNTCVTAQPIQVNIPSGDEMGVNMHLDYSGDSSMNDDSVTEGIDGFTELVQKWVNMFHDILLLGTDNALFNNIDKKLTSEDIYAYKIYLLQRYEEVYPLLQSIFKFT